MQYRFLKDSIRFARKQKQIAAAVLVAGALIGCGGGGGGSSSSSSSVPTGTYNVSVVDDAIVGATVTAPECATFTDNGNGSYTLKECISKPSTITAVGGSFDANGTVVNQTAPLILKTSQLDANGSFVVTPLSTLASQENNLSALALALGISEGDLLKDNAANRALMRAVNAILISAREAGITKYEDFVKDLKTLITSSGSTGIAAINAAKADMMDPNKLAGYKAKYGVVFGGFVNDTTGVDLSDNPLAQVQAVNTVPAGKVRLGGFVYDSAISNAVLELYDGVSPIEFFDENGSNLGTSVESDALGRYQININATLLNSSKVFKLIATKGTTVLISYITTDELKAGKIGSKVSSGTYEDLVVSNVTTAKAVMVDKLEANADTNATQMIQTRAIVESLYAEDILKIASDIKAVVDGGASLSQTDTLALAVAVANGATTGYSDYSDAITADPILSGQLNSTNSVTAGTTTMRSVMEGKTLYQFDYRSGFSNANPFTYGTIQIKADGSLEWKDYKQEANSTSWIVYESQTNPAGTFQWSSDGNTVYEVGDYWVPSKHTLLAKKTVTYNNMSANIYFIQDEVTAEPTEGFYTNFAATADASGTYNSATKQIAITYSDGGYSTFYLGNNGYLQWSSASGTETGTAYQTITRYGREFIVIQWDDNSAIYYISGANVYKKEYKPIGTVETSWFTDSTALVLIWKSMDAQQRADLSNAIQTAFPNGWSWQGIQRILYDAIQSLAQ